MSFAGVIEARWEEESNTRLRYNTETHSILQLQERINELRIKNCELEQKNCELLMQKKNAKVIIYCNIL